MFIVSYDISEDERRIKVYQTLRGFGTRLQYSVWRCELSRMGLVQLKAALVDLINHRTDQILFIDLGPAEGRGDSCVSAIGRAYQLPDRDPWVF